MSVTLPKGCTCGGSIWTDSMCVPCLEKVERSIVSKIEELEESIQPIHERIEELVSDLDIVRWHIDNPVCPGGCGEDTAHCQCETGPKAIDATESPSETGADTGL